MHRPRSTNRLFRSASDRKSLRPPLVQELEFAELTYKAPYTSFSPGNYQDSANGRIDGRECGKQETNNRIDLKEGLVDPPQL